MTDGSLVAGVDGAPGGWVVAVARRGSGGGDRLEVLDVHATDHVGTVLDDLAGGRLAVVCVDMPIGLPAAGRRACEASARAALGARRSSVFWTPPRPVLDVAHDYRAADACCRRLSGLGLSRQAFALLPKVAELDDALGALAPAASDRVWEAHPELAVARVLGHPARHPKRAASGVAERLQGLGTLGVDWARWLADPPAGDGGDVIDALYLADTASWVAAGRCPPVHGDGALDERGLPQRIVG